MILLDYPNDPVQLSGWNSLEIQFLTSPDLGVGFENTPLNQIDPVICRDEIRRLTNLPRSKQGFAVTEKTYTHVMEKVLKITSLKDTTSEFAYWSTKSPIERLEAVELLRQQYFSLNKDVPPRLQ